MRRETISLDRLREVLFYDPETGLWTWRVSLSARAQAGKLAGCVRGNGYVQIRVDGVIYMAHRLAWFYVTGTWPEKGVDHRDVCGTNNRFENLRKADQSQNMANRGAQKNNSCGFKGVVREPNCLNRWRARIKKDGKDICLGSFASAEEANNAYLKAATKLFDEFARAA